MDGLEGYPVYTRKVYIPTFLILPVRKTAGGAKSNLPAVRDAQRPSLAAIYQLAGQNYYPGQYEFQCLHGMGEPLYEQVTGKVADGKITVRVAYYAPVGT